ncbi:hypothetical protein DSO57_1029349 [Entomophthora muscae]|uniref:Uncharacterized protein n=1 Tax=Entomophthora muscae TaxID=34485 RepID=A0ACC2UB39_9FUNG|nr:hypothetical protein DSO57_1029349 [Entomophthora muscae]
MVLCATPWLLKETAVYLEPHQRCLDFFPTNEQSQHESWGADAHLNMSQVFTKEQGKLHFLPDDLHAICYRVIGASKNILEFQLIDLSESSSIHPLARLIRVHFDYAILPSVDLFSVDTAYVVCWVCSGSGPVVRLQLNALDDFSSSGRPLIRQQFSFQGLESDLTLFKALDATSVVAATASGSLFHGELVDQDRSFVCKTWKQSSLMSSLLSSFSRFVKTADADLACYQTVSLASYPLGDRKHLVFSLCRDRVVRVWSTKLQQQIHQIPLISMDISGNATSQPLHLLPEDSIDALRVYSASEGTVRLMVHTNCDAGSIFLVYRLKVNMDEVASSEFEYHLPFSNDSRKPSQLVDFFVSSKDSVDALWAIWKVEGKNSIFWLPHNYPEGSGPRVPFSPGTTRWLPVASDLGEDVKVPQVDPETPPNEIPHIFLDFLGRPNYFTLRAIKYAADLHFRDKLPNIHAPRSYETPQALFKFLQQHMGASLPRDNRYNDRLIEEWSNFAKLCIQSKEAMHMPVSFSLYRGTPFIAYADSIGVLRQCDILEALADTVTTQLPSVLEAFYLESLLDKKMNLADRLVQLSSLVSLFRLARRVWASSTLTKASRNLTSIIGDPDASSALTLLNQADKPVLATYPDFVTLATAAINLWELLTRVHSLLDYTTDTIYEGSKEEAPCGRFLSDALVASTFKQLVLSRSNLARDLLLIYWAVGACLELDDRRARECLDGIETMWRYFGTQSLLLGLFNPLPVQAAEKKRHSRRSSAFVDVSFDTTLSKFYGQKGNHTIGHQTPSYYWYSMFQGFICNVAKPADVLSYGLAAFSHSLLAPLTPGLPETSSLFYQLVTWLEFKGQYDLALLFVRYLQCIPTKSFLAGRIMLAQGRFQSAYSYFNNAIDTTMENSFSPAHPLRDLLPQALLDNGVSAYFGHLALWFQTYDAYAEALLLCHRALNELSEQEDPSSRRARDTLWKISFELTLAQQNYHDAYSSMVYLHDKQVQTEILRVLIVTMCAEEKVALLCSFSFPELEASVKVIVWDLIYSIVNFENLSVNYFDVLASFNLSRQDVRGAASVQYHYLLWLTAQANLSPDVLPNWLDQLVTAARFSSTNLASLPQGSSWLKTLPRFLSERERLDPFLGSTKAPLEVVTHEMLLRLHIILVVQRDFSSIFPHYQLIRNPMPPTEVIKLLLDNQVFPQAIQISLRFQLNLSPVFQRLAAACLKRPELQKEESITEGNPWPLLKSSLDQFSSAHSIKPGEYELATMSTFLAAGWGDNLPTWLLERANNLNQAGVVSLLLHHSYVEQSADLATKYLQKLLDQSTATAPSTFSHFFPINLMDRITNALELKKSEPQLASFRKLLDQYFEHAKYNTAAIMNEKTS